MSVNTPFGWPNYPSFVLDDKNELIYSAKRSLILPDTAVDKPMSNSAEQKEITFHSTVNAFTNSKINGSTMPTKEESTSKDTDTIDLTKKSNSNVSSPIEKNVTVPITSGKSKHAPIPIYRPPSLRGGEGNCIPSPKLNVHAKEFIMSSGHGKNSDVMRSNSSKTDQAFQNFVTKMKESTKFNKTFPLNLSNSSGNITLNTSKLDSSQIGKPASFKDPTNFSSNSSYNLQRAKSIGDVLVNTRVNEAVVPKVQFSTLTFDKNNNRYSTKSSLIKEKKSPPSSAQQVPGNLKRSKSMGAADALKFMEMEASFSQLLPTFNEYNLFPEKMQTFIKQAIHSSHRMTDKNKIVLARTVIEYGITDKKFANSVAKLSLIIMEKDKSGAYLDSLLNTCQMFYQKKETCLWNDEGKFTSFLSFLTEMFTELKRSKLQMKLLSDSMIPPKITLLMLISRCCLDILVRNEMHSISEIECLFLTLTSVGRDVELELPAVFQKIFHTIRIVFLRSLNGPKIQKTLLQLIELRAANWQLPVSALNYYYPQSGD